MHLRLKRKNTVHAAIEGLVCDEGRQYQNVVVNFEPTWLEWFVSWMPPNILCTTLQKLKRATKNRWQTSCRKKPFFCMIMPALHVATACKDLLQQLQQEIQEYPLHSPDFLLCNFTMSLDYSKKFIKRSKL